MGPYQVKGLLGIQGPLVQVSFANLGFQGFRVSGLGIGLKKVCFGRQALNSQP